MPLDISSMMSHTEFKFTFFCELKTLNGGVVSHVKFNMETYWHRHATRCVTPVSLGCHSFGSANKGLGLPYHTLWVELHFRKSMTKYYNKFDEMM